MLCAVTSSSDVAFLNSLMPSPKDLPNPASFEPPKRSKTTTAIMTKSWGPPNPNAIGSILKTFLLSCLGFARLTRNWLHNRGRFLIHRLMTHSIVNCLATYTRSQRRDRTHRLVQRLNFTLNRMCHPRKFVCHFPQFSHCLPKLLSNFRKLFGAKHNQSDNENNRKISRTTKTKRTDIHCIISSGHK